MKNFTVRFSNVYFLLLASAIGIFYMFVIANTYDVGDSLEHYEISRYSWKHPYLFFDNWGKPVFTFLSSPFTQFGWIGMKFFNTIVGVLTCFFLAKIIEKEVTAVSPYWALILFCVPDWVLALNSGLTEPLFALIVVAALYGVVADKTWLAAILISFLPMIRNEGYIIMTIYGCYFMLTKQWKSIILLSTGTLIISIAGYATFYNHDPLWIFHTNPYLSKHAKYEHGEWGDYFVSYYYMTGIPITILTIISASYYLIKKLRYSNVIKAPDTFLWLAFAVFIAFFSAHMIFWKFGLFNSFGMSRVLLSIIPLAIISIVYFISEMKKYTGKMYRAVAGVIALILVIFPYSGNKSGFILPKDFEQQPDIKIFQKVIAKLKKENLPYTNIYATAPAFYWVYNADQFSAGFNKLHVFTNKSAISHCIIVYDSWYALMESNVSEKNITDKIGADKLLFVDQAKESSLVKIYYVP